MLIHDGGHAHCFCNDATGAVEYKRIETVAHAIDNLPEPRGIQEHDLPGRDDRARRFDREVHCPRRCNQHQDDSGNHGDLHCRSTCPALLMLYEVVVASGKDWVAANVSAHAKAHFKSSFR